MRTLAIFALSLSACVPSFQNAGPLSFAQISYVGPKGQAWPTKGVELPVIKERFGLAEAPTVSYVELNPDGKKTIIFIHGLGSYLKFWRYQLDHFAAQGYRVLALDMVGYGKSSKPGLFPYTMEAMADVVLEFKRAAGVEKPILVGHSMGGHTALTYAIRFPGELEALVLTAPAGFEKFSPREKAWFRSVVTTVFIKATPEEGIWGSVAKNNFSRWRPELEWLVEERVRLVGSPDFDQYAYANLRSIHGLTHTDFVRGNLDKVKVPAVIVFGHDDRLIPNQFMHAGPTQEIMQFGQRGIAGSTLVGLPGCGHTVQIDCPEEYNSAVGKFLAKLPDVAPARDEDMPAGDGEPR